MGSRHQITAALRELIAAEMARDAGRGTDDELETAVVEARRRYDAARGLRPSECRSG